jgi:hypothetical protein
MYWMSAWCGGLHHWLDRSAVGYWASPVSTACCALCDRLFTLPEELSCLTQLFELSLRRNALSSLPGNLGALRMLIHLDVGRNFLAALPPSLPALVALRKLYLSCNKLEALGRQPKEWISRCAPTCWWAAKHVLCWLWRILR